MVKVKEDLTGRRFGKLVVIKQDEDYVTPSGTVHARWLCRCDCGNTKSIIQSNLIRGLSKTCGCRKFNDDKVMPREDLAGQRFGRLFVIKQAADYIKPDGRHVARWECKCDCGNTTYVTGENLKQKTKSCGCVAREKATENHKKENIFIIHDEYIEGIDINQRRFIFDVDDFEKVSSMYWGVSKGSEYVIHSDRKNGRIPLHRFLMDASDDMVVDHINHNRTDNRKVNLRICTVAKNNINTKIKCTNTSGVVGVHRHKQSGRWVGELTINGNSIRKLFKNKEDAVLYRQQLEEEYFGEYGYSASMEHAEKHKID